MNKITNINEAKAVGVGEKFIFGEYQGVPIEWLKLNEVMAISVYILDYIVFSRNNNSSYASSDLRLWCNKFLGKPLSLECDRILILDNEAMANYVDEKSRIAEPTKWAITHGLTSNEYWTSSPGEKPNAGSIIDKNGKIIKSNPIAFLEFPQGVRPAIKI